MPQIMQQCRTQGEQTFLRHPILIPASFKLGNNPPRNFIDSKRMREPAVLRTMKSKIRGAKLADPPQALKFLGINQPPNNGFLHVDIIVNRIFENLLL
ncbi:hypothetical protein D3C74_441260 [compost metagenome]